MGQQSKTDLNRIQGNNTELPKYECKIKKYNEEGRITSIEIKSIN